MGGHGEADYDNGAEDGDSDCEATKPTMTTMMEPALMMVAVLMMINLA